MESMSYVAIVISFVALMIRVDCASVCYGEIRDFSGMVGNCLEMYENLELIEFESHLNNQSFVNCDDLYLPPNFMQFISPVDLIDLTNNAQRLLRIIEDFPNKSSMTNFQLSLVQLTKIVLQQANTPYKVANETKLNELVHAILRLKIQFEHRFPSDFNVVAWNAFVSKHAAIVDAISLQLKPSIQRLVDFMNNNHKNFTNQTETMVELSKLFGKVFNVYFVNETSDELEKLKPEAWSLLYHVLDKAPKDSEVFKTLSRFNHTTFFAANREQIILLSGSYLLDFMTDTDYLLSLPKKGFSAKTNYILKDILDRFDVAVALCLRFDDLRGTRLTAESDFTMIAKYVVSQFYVEITNDERFMNNTQLLAIKNRLGESMNLMKEQGFLEAEIEADLGVPYDELDQKAFEDYLNRRLTGVNERFNEIKTYGDDDLDNDDFENDHYEGDEDYDEEVDAVLGRAICALLHSVVKIKIEKQLFVNDEHLRKLMTLGPKFYQKFPNEMSLNYVLVEMMEDSFRRTFAL